MNRDEAGPTANRARLPQPTNRNFVSPEELSAALLRLSPTTLDCVLGPAAAMRFRRRRETVRDLIVGAIRMGVSPIALFDSLDVPQREV